MCLHRGIRFHSTSDWHLPGVVPVGSSATALNQLNPCMALKSALRKPRYRVSVHGTLAEKRLPSFHTRVRSASMKRAAHDTAQITEVRAVHTTGVSYTLLPGSCSRLHRTRAHGLTVYPYTEIGRTTGVRYTAIRPNTPVPLRFPAANFTKPSSTNHNNRADVLFGIKGGDK